MDVASSNSVFVDVLRKKYPGLVCYRQDLKYPSGVKNFVVGSNAENIPLGDETITKMGLHCSFEHFEGDADYGFIKEAYRLLRPGGRVCIIPLYSTEKYHILTNAEMWVSHWIPKFEKGSPLYLHEPKVNVHGRFYNPEMFYERRVKTCPDFDVKIYHFSKNKDIQGCPTFACVFTK